MSAAVPSSGADRASAERGNEGRSFFVVLAVIACSVLLLGIIGFGYLRSNTPLGLFAGSGRPLAAATVFVPSRSPFTVSLLTKPERLIALHQAVINPGQREQARHEVAQVQQTLLRATGLDYERDIQPWIGEEITYAYTDVDLDQAADNGLQPGYLLAIEIAPNRQQQAQSFLQVFWQQQSLAGNVPQSEQINGVRVLSGASALGQSSRGAALSSVTALVGNQFVIFANDVRVIRRSLRASQTAQNLAQDLIYRQAADTLPPQRIGLAYFDTALLQLPSTFAAVGIGITRTGLTADLSLADRAINQRNLASLRRGADEPSPETALPNALPSDTVQYLPANSDFVVVGDSLVGLASALSAAGVPTDILPDFLQLGQSLPANPWQQMTTDYALAAELSDGRAAGRSAAGKSVSSRDWILAVKRDAKTDSAVQALDQAAIKAGYSVVPVMLADSSDNSRDDDNLETEPDVSLKGNQATAWTRFKVGKGRQASSVLDTELLGLHLQRGDYELYASSLAAMNSSMAQPSQGAIAMSSSSLRQSPLFLQATASIATPNDGYLYVDWPAIAPMIYQVLPAVGAIDRAARPLSNYIRAIAATRQGEYASFFIQLKEASS